MLKTGKKILCTLLVVVMCLTSVPLQGFMGLDFSSWFASEAEAAMITEGTIIGVLDKYEPMLVVFLGNGNNRWVVKSITVDGVVYDVNENSSVYYENEYVEASVNKEVAISLYNNKVVNFSTLEAMPSPNFDLHISDLFLNCNEQGKIEKKRNEISGSVYNYNQTNFDTELLNERGLCKLENATVSFVSKNTDVLYFKESEKTENLGNISLGSNLDFTVKVRRNEDFIMKKSDKEIKVDIECTFKATLDGNSVYRFKTLTVTIKNDYYETPKPVFKEMTVRELLNDMYNRVDDCVVWSEYEDEEEEKIKSTLRSNLDGARAINGLIELIDQKEFLNVYVDTTEIYTNLLSNRYGTAISQSYNIIAESIVTELGDVVEKTKSDLKSYLGKWLNSPEFDEFFNWYMTETGYRAGQTNKYTEKCPIDITVTDADGILVLSIIDDVITFCDSTIMAYVINSKKIIYLPTDIEHNIEIIATDNGTMDYSVSMYTPSGLERVIRYDNVPLVKDDSYSAIVPCESTLPTDTYNLISNKGIEIEADYDSLPPVEDNIVDVIVAEELFDGFPIEIIDLVANTMFNMKSVVDLSSYDISTDDAVALFSAIAKYYPTEYSLIANSDFTYKIIVSPNLDRIMKIRFYYGDDANLSVYQKRVNDLNAEIDALVAQVEGMDDFEKALYIHDYIVLNCEYDLELLEYLETNGTLTGEMRSERYTEYSVLVNGTGICGSYALAYRAIMNAAGIECLYLSSAQMNHAWNMVKIDGNWYHVDCCWDDPVPDQYGRARRTYFLRTDVEIMELNHYSWTPGQYKATSEKYSDMPRNYDIKQKYDGGKWYYLEGTTLYSTDEYGKNETEIASLSASSIDVDNGNIYYSIGRCIYKFDADKNESHAVYFMPRTKCGDRIESAQIKNFYINYALQTAEIYRYIYDESYITLKDTVALQQEYYNKITGVSVSSNEESVNVFSEIKLNAEILATVNTDSLDITWSSSDANIARVDADGKVTGKNVGTVTITANVLNYSSSCTVTVLGDGLSGSCNDTVFWNFDSATKTLKIFGDGDMPDYTGKETPWKMFRNELEKVKIEEGVTNISANAFPFCSTLNEIEIAESITSIGSKAFLDCLSLKSVFIPKNVQNIAEEAFSNCIQINEFIVDEENNHYFNDEYGVLYYRPSLIAMETIILVQYPLGRTDETYHIIDTTDSVAIGKSAFMSNTYLKEIIIPESVASIGERAFSKCFDLEKVILPKTVTSIMDGTFEFCRSLKNINIDANITSIGVGAFNGCSSLEEITIPALSDAIINSYAFSDCKMLKNVYIDNSITTIGAFAFFGCKSLINIELPTALRTISNSAFECCNRLEAITVPENVQYISERAFYNCDNLNSIIFKNASCTVKEFLNQSDLLLYGLKNSTIKTYAEENGIKFIDIDAEGHKHSYSIKSPKNSCENVEYKEYECECGDVYKVKISNSGHKDINFDSRCDECNIYLGKIDSSENESKYVRYEVFVYDSWSNSTNHSWLKIYYLSKANTIEYILIEQEEKFWSGCQGKNVVLYEGIVEGIPFAIEEYAFCTFGRTLEYTNGTFYIGNNKDDLKPEVSSLSFRAEDGILGGKENLLTKSILHDHTYYESDLSHDSTHTEDGYKEYVCTCGVKYVNEIKATGHNYQIISTIPGTCTTAPVYTYSCSTCGDTHTKEGKIDDGHKYIETVIAPTCTEKGYTTATCSECGEAVVYDFTSPIGHEFVINKSADYCSAHGTINYSCKNCDYTEVVAADTSELKTTTVTVEATCTKGGTVSKICDLCGATVSTEILSALSHDYSDEWTVDTEPTCTENGSKSKHCTRCDAKREVTVVEATGHKHPETWTERTAAACETEGLEYRVCGTCGKAEETRAIPKLRHNYSSEWTVDKAASCTENGSKSHHCTRCNVKADVTVIEKSDHSMSAYVVTKQPTCTDKGTERADCSSCDHYETRSIAAKGHNYGDNGICSNCGSDKTKDCSHLCHKSGFMGFIWMIVQFFWKLFKMNPVCSCGAKHY